jgi:Leucine-rich repeat (LRR) protein
MSSDIKLLLYLLKYANQSYYESLRDFLSPCFQGYLVSLATNRKWDEETLRGKMTAVDDDDFKGHAMNLADMDLQEIPRSIFNLVEVENLVALDLSYNEDITDIAGVEKLKNLKNLDLEGCGLTDIKEVFQLTNLLMLDVMHNQITDIPKDIEKLQNLQQLKIKGNPIRLFSTCINGMANLKILICEKKVVQLVDFEFKVWADRQDYVQVYERKEAIKKEEEEDKI